MSDDFDVEVEARGHADEWPPWSPHHARSTREALEALLRRAMAHARREGAGEMRERAAQACTDRANALDALLEAYEGDGYSPHAWNSRVVACAAWDGAARHIRALPIDPSVAGDVEMDSGRDMCPNCGAEEGTHCGPRHRCRVCEHQWVSPAVPIK